MHQDEQTLITADGQTITEKDYWSPGSHCAMGDAQPEDYLIFNDDGTGAYFSRWIIKQKQGEIKVIIYENGKYVEKNELSRIREFKWDIQGEDIILTFWDKKQNKWATPKKHNFKWNITPVKSKVELGNVDEYGIKTWDEIIIYDMGSFLRVDSKKAEEILTIHGLTNN